MTPDPSFPTCIDSSSLGFIAPINPGCIFIDVTVSSPLPVTLIEVRSAPKLRRRPRSDGLIGAASTLIRTSSSEGIGFATVAIEISIFPSLVTLDLISFEVWSDILGSPFSCYLKIY